MKTVSEAEFHWSQQNEDGKELIFRRMRGTEALGRLPSYEVELLHMRTSAGAIQPDELLGKTAAVELAVTNEASRFFNGFVTHFELDGTEEGKDLYRVTLRPWLWFLTLSADCRIFHKKTVVEILQAVFGAYKPAELRNDLRGEYRKREFCVQYRESDFAFVSRLMELEGIFYYFEYTASGHTLVLCDAKSTLPPVDGPQTLMWAQAMQGDDARNASNDTVLRFRRTHGIHTTDYGHSEFDYENPASDLLAQAQREVTHARPERLTVFEFPGGYHDHAETGENFAKADEAARLAAIRAASFKLKADLSTGLSRGRTLAVGRVFKLDGHGLEQNNIQYKIIHTEILAEFAGVSAPGTTGSNGYTCRFEAVPAEYEFHPEIITPVPVIAGSQTGIVVGGEEDEIATEKLGRVKVRFMWDRQAKGAQTAAGGLINTDADRSCWVRVSHPWAGKKFGMIAMPRVGDEVVVAFLEGDPDRPIIVGRVYNGSNLPPYDLPAQATVSGIRTRSSKEGGESDFNELRFDDKKDSEYIWLQAQKDFHRLVKNDAWDEIVANSTATVGKNYLGKIGENAALDIGKEVRVKIGADSHVSLAADANLKVDGALGLTVGKGTDLKLTGATAMTVSAGMDLDVSQSLNITSGGSINIKCEGLVIDGGSQISIQAGGSFIVLSASGVAVSGTMIQLNSGGSASPASSAQFSNPTAPQEPDAPPEHKDPLPPSNE